MHAVLANMIITECKKFIAVIYCLEFVMFRFVDDTFLTVKKNDIRNVLNHFNSFDRNSEFTIDTIGNFVPYLLNIEICLNGLGIYHESISKY